MCFRLRLETWLALLAVSSVNCHFCQPVLAQNAPELAIEEHLRARVSADLGELARSLQVSATLDRLLYNRQSGPHAIGSTEFLEELSLRQELTEVVLSAMLDVHRVTARIDFEVAQNLEYQGILSARRDKALKYNSIANIISGGISSGLGNALDLNSSFATEQAGDVVEMVAGSLQTALGFLALRQSGGQKKVAGDMPNMLAKFLDRPAALPEANYPDTVWQFLNSTPGASSGSMTRRQLLINKWVRVALLSDPRDARSRSAIDRVAGVGQHRINIDLLQDRQTMLLDLRSLVNQMSLGLRELLDLIRKRQ